MNVNGTFPFAGGTLGENVGRCKTYFRFLGPVFWANLEDNLGGYN